MDLANYTKVRTAAERTLVACWVAYCEQPDGNTLDYFNRLNDRLELAALYASDVNYQAAVAVLPLLNPLSTRATAE